jgi:hypothetical protein
MLAIFGGVLAPETIGRKFKTPWKWLSRIIRKPGFLIRDLCHCGVDCHKTTDTAANPRLKTEDRPVICAKYKSSLNGDFDDICNTTCGPFDRFDCPLRFEYRAILANA